jgi:hypothetical protein
MPLTIATDLITSDRTMHTARPVPGHPHTWRVTWLPGRLLDRYSAITAIVIAEVAADGPDPGDRIWPHVQSWAGELDLTAPQTIALASQPPETGTGKEPAVGPPDREAAGP